MRTVGYPTVHIGSQLAVHGQSETDFRGSTGSAEGGKPGGSMEGSSLRDGYSFFTCTTPPAITALLAQIGLMVRKPRAGAKIGGDGLVGQRGRLEWRGKAAFSFAWASLQRQRHGVIVAGL